MTAFRTITPMAGDPKWSGGRLLRRSGIAASIGPNTRPVHYMFSYSSVARDGHTIATSGWDLTAFRTNPVCLWSHMADQPPIGRVVDIAVVGDQLRGSVVFADASTYEFADTVFKLVA